MKGARSNAEALFLNTLQDLAARAAAADEYMILGASALIRKLLIDGSPLVDQVNRNYRLRLVFEIPNRIPRFQEFQSQTFGPSRMDLIRKHLGRVSRERLSTETSFSQPSWRLLMAGPIHCAKLSYSKRT
jgi:hypothetical protein